jgi:flagellar biosynthesis repressor protein FlbT
MPVSSLAVVHDRGVRPSVYLLTYEVGMTLKIVLKPHERMILGGAVIHNGTAKAEFIIENNIPVLRQKNILSPSQADTPAKRIYLMVQLMYIDGDNLSNHHKLYWELVKDFLSAAPRSLDLIDRINEYVLQTHYYDALKAARDLIDYEQEVFQRAKQCN